MASNNNSERSPNESAEEQIKEANCKLAALHRARILTETEYCLQYYQHWDDDVFAPIKSPSIDARLLRLLADENVTREFASSKDADALVDSAELFTRQLRLYRKALRNDYDVFLCHNSSDKREVRTIGRQLKRYGLLPWLDEDEIRPGESWMSRLQDEIEHVKTCAVVLGRDGVGPWQEQELNSAIQLFVGRQLPVIPIVLPTCHEVPKMPVFLRAFHRVDYRSLDPDPTEQLVWAITGKRPTI